MTSARRNHSLLTSRELCLVTALVAAATFLGIATLRSLPETVRWGLLDLRDWTVELSPPPPSGRIERLPPREPGREPFELTLMLARPPREGDSVIAHAEIPAAGPGPYCFRLWLDHPYLQEPPSSRGMFQATVRAGDVTSEVVLLERHPDPVEVALRDIEPRNGAIEVRVEIRALASRPRDSWRRASETHVQLADLWRCRGDGS